ncbi:TetR family transcriptional regulator [Frondihabitans australicus]|uniref:TetR family transcriptional regulator n=1 Tax=Frondihabitans australicus TaxID=386892 RepID=A0A495IHE3_9MICO|nr:TetR family transcriptional regulator [Frondihabitans australicus]
MPGLRERKKLALRARLSDTATAMFAEHGYDNVRVSDIALACGVTPKTLYSYFPTKESLLFERGDALALVLSEDRASDIGLLDAVLDAIRREIDQLATTSPTATSGDDLIRGIRGFVSLVAATPALRAVVAERSEALTTSAAEALSRRNGLPPTHPENQVAAGALISLWRIHLTGLLEHGRTSSNLTELRRRTMADVDRGAALVRPVVEQVSTARRTENVAVTS